MLKDLYECIEKIVHGNVYTIAARPGIGKTTVARHIANMLVETGQKVLYIETEGLAEQERLKRLNDKYDSLYRRLISAEEIRNVAFIGRYNVIIVDSFQYIYHKRKEDVAYKLKCIAEELDIVVIVLSHISRKADMRKDHQPRISDMTRKMCGTLWKTSDGVILLYRNSYYEANQETDIMNIIVAKNRVEKNFIGKSNGETAIDYFLTNINEPGLYLLDEPENSLSASYQRELSQYLFDSARFFGAQLIIATHSPFILSIPGAKIYNLDSEELSVTEDWTTLDNMKEYYALFKQYSEKVE